MTCPVCGAPITADAFLIGDVGVCPACAASLVRDGARVRRAAATDLEALSDAQIQQLRKARPSAWRQAVIAHKKALGGR